MTEAQTEEFDKLAKQLIEWLCNNCHPHTTVIVTSTTAELVEGVRGIQTTEFVKD